MAIDFSTDPVLRDFVRDIVNDGGATKDVAEFILHKPALAPPITTGYALFFGMKMNLYRARVAERDVLPDAYFTAEIWRLI